MDTTAVTCPTCFEEFHVPVPPAEETPCEVDYDCEVCCRPMVLSLFEQADEVIAEARSIHE